MCKKAARSVRFDDALSRATERALLTDAQVLWDQVSASEERARNVLRYCFVVGTRVRKTGAPPASPLQLLANKARGPTTRWGGNGAGGGANSASGVAEA